MKKKPKRESEGILPITESSPPILSLKKMKKDSGLHPSILQNNSLQKETEYVRMSRHYSAEAKSRQSSPNINVIEKHSISPSDKKVTIKLKSGLLKPRVIKQRPYSTQDQVFKLRARMSRSLQRRVCSDFIKSQKKHKKKKKSSKLKSGKTKSA